MAINLGSNFNMTAALPLDGRDQVADLTARDAIASGVRWIGMPTYVLSEDKRYVLKGGITNAHWEEDGGAGGLDPAELIHYVYGDELTDGSIRINTTDGTFTLEKRVAGVWTFMGSFSV